jgi:hypothetical protein
MSETVLDLLHKQKQNRGESKLKILHYEANKVSFYKTRITIYNETGKNKFERKFERISIPRQDVEVLSEPNGVIKIMFVAKVQSKIKTHKSPVYSTSGAPSFETGQVLIIQMRDE